MNLLLDLCVKFVNSGKRKNWTVEVTFFLLDNLWTGTNTNWGLVEVDTAYISYISGTKASVNPRRVSPKMSPFFVSQYNSTEKLVSEPFCFSWKLWVFLELSGNAEVAGETFCWPIEGVSLIKVENFLSSGKTLWGGPCGVSKCFCYWKTMRNWAITFFKRFVRVFLLPFYVSQSSCFRGTLWIREGSLFFVETFLSDGTESFGRKDFLVFVSTCLCLA